MPHRRENIILIQPVKNSGTYKKTFARYDSNADPDQSILITLETRIRNYIIISLHKQRCFGRCS
jgi:hypothetical protein